MEVAFVGGVIFGGKSAKEKGGLSRYGEMSLSQISTRPAKAM